MSFRPDALSARQREIVTLLFRGLKAADIAAELHIATSTVYVQLNNIADRFGREEDEVRSLHWWIYAAYEYGRAIERARCTQIVRPIAAKAK